MFFRSIVSVLKSGAILMVVSFAVSVTSAFASPPPRIHITQGRVKPDPIAFVQPHGNSQEAAEIGAVFIEIIRRNFCSCGAFSSVSNKLFIQDSATLARTEPRMADWQLIKARFLICGAVEAASGGYKVTVRVYDINCKQKLLVFSVIVNKANLRKAAHMASDQIYTRLTGEKGMFNTQITYIEPVASERRGRSGVSYRRTLKKMDQDGANCVALTDGRDLVLTPRYSPDGKTIAFLRYRTERVGGRNKRMAHVALVDVATKKVTPLLTPAHFKAISQANGGAEVNMTYAPRFSPDGKFLCFSLIIDGKSAIYTISRDGSNVRRLTTPVSIDTSPAYSADGRKIVFTSDRSGKEKIYIMNTDGTNVMRITSNEGKYSQPVFSPRGDLIAFSKQIGNQFFIGVVQPNGQGERLIVQAGMAEAPQWSPNGRYIIFTRQTTMSAPRRICIIDLTGLFMREIQTPGEAYDAYWSPLLQ